MVINTGNTSANNVLINGTIVISGDESLIDWFNVTTPYTFTTNISTLGIKAEKISIDYSEHPPIDEFDFRRSVGELVLTVNVECNEDIKKDVYVSWQCLQFNLT